MKKIISIIALSIVLTTYLAGYPGQYVKASVNENIDFNGTEELLPSEVVTQLKSLLQPSNSEQYAIGSIRNEDSWGLGTIIIKYDQNSELKPEEYSDYQSNHTKTFAFVLVNNAWQTTLDNSTQRWDVLKYIPDEELSIGIKDSLFHKNSTLSSISFSQVYFGYKFPYLSTNGFTLSRYPGVWHNENSGNKAVDFGQSQNVNVLASAPGYISSVCKNAQGSQAWIQIKTENPSNPGTYLDDEKLLYLHFSKGTIPANIQVGGTVTRGQILGKLISSGDELSLPCPMSSDGRHVHILFPYKPFHMDGYSFTTYENGNLQILDTNEDEVTFNGSTVFYSTQPFEGVGTWEITNNQTINSDTSYYGDILITSTGTLTVNTGHSLNFDFANQKIVVKSGGKLLVKSTAKIY